MKKKELKTYRTKKTSEIEGDIKKTREALNDVFLKIKSGKEKNVKKLKNLKRELAQKLTILNEKKIMEKEEKLKEAKK